MQFNNFIYLVILALITLLVVYFVLCAVFKYYPLPKILFEEVFQIDNHKTQMTLTFASYLFVILLVPFILIPYAIEPNSSIYQFINSVVLGIYGAIITSLKS